MTMNTPLPKIPGTTPFDGDQAKKGYALNKMCFSFNSADCRAEFLKDEEAYLAKFAGIFGLNMQDIGAQQTGMTVEEFKAKLVAAGQ